MTIKTLILTRDLVTLIMIKFFGILLILSLLFTLSGVIKEMAQIIFEPSEKIENTRKKFRNVADILEEWQHPQF